MTDYNVSAILLAAGFSRRMGTDKLLLPFRGKTLLVRAVELLTSLPVRQRILVTTPSRLETLALPAGIVAVENHSPEAGQSESIRLGLNVADGDGYLFLTADQPLLDTATVERLLRRGGDGIVYPTVEGMPRSPVLFAARFRPMLLTLTGDEGGRRIRQENPGACVPLEALDPLPLQDIDTPEDYRDLPI